MPAKPRLGPAEAPTPLVPSGARISAPGPLGFGCLGAGVRVAPFRSHRPRSAPPNASGRRPSWIEATGQYEGGCGGEWVENCSKCDFYLTVGMPENLVTRQAEHSAGRAHCPNSPKVRLAFETTPADGHMF